MRASAVRARRLLLRAALPGPTSPSPPVVGAEQAFVPWRFKVLSQRPQSDSREDSKSVLSATRLLLFTGAEVCLVSGEAPAGPGHRVLLLGEATCAAAAAVRWSGLSAARGEPAHRQTCGPPCASRSFWTRVTEGQTSNSRIWLAQPPVCFVYKFSLFKL